MEGIALRAGVVPSIDARGPGGPFSTVGAIVTALGGPIKSAETTSRPAFPTVSRPH